MSVPFLSVKPRAIKLKVSPRFPAQLIGRAGIDVTKQNGDYFLDLDFNDFPVIGGLPVQTTYTLILDPLTGKYAQLPLSLLGGGGGVPEAPNDGNLYGRKALAWSVVPGVAPADLSTTVRIVGNDNMIGGRTAGAALTTATQSVAIGAEAGASFTSDTGHTLVGYQAGKALNSASSTWNTFIGHIAGRLVTTGQSNVALGRASMAYDTDGGYNVAIGHAAYFMGLHSQGVIAIGDTAAGADTAGTANWGGTGLTYFGSISDVACSYIGRNTGKSTASARTNAHAIGTLARIPNRDNVMVLGHGLAAVTAAGRIYDGWARVDVTSAAAMTITAAQLLAGMVIRGGSTTGAVNDTTDTAANLVLNGPGHNAELPCSVEISFGNVTNFTVTLVGGSGVSLSSLGLGGAVASGALAKFRICFLNVTAGSESVFIYRVG